MTSAFQLADDYVDDACSLDPVLSTQLGVPGSDGEWGDSFGLAGIDASLSLTRSYREQVTPHLQSPDFRERLAARVMAADFDEEEAAYRAGDHLRVLRHMGSPLHQLRLVFDVMRSDTPEARSAIVRRLSSMGQPLAGYRQVLEEGLSRGVVASSRQVVSVVSQTRRLADDPGSFDEIVAKAAGPGGEGAEEAASVARSAFGRLGEWLETVYLPASPGMDGVGREVYERFADRLVGMPVDPDEAYRWGWDELARLTSEMDGLAERILPGQGTEAVIEYLESAPAVTANGTAELLEFVTATLAEAVDGLAGSHFDVPDVIRPLTVQLAPPGSPLGVYYRRPSEDFSRPGGVWYSVGDQQLFPLYQHVSTAYHEGFPGHHLQIATAMHQRDEISRYQRLMTWCPGYGEGWGMYAEVLMGELGFLEQPHHRFGMLAKQMYRTARVVADIGLHLGLRIDESSPLAPGEPWGFEVAAAFMERFGFRTPAQARDEVLRYLGWPGQAIAYKIGERELLAIRAETRARLGSSYDMRDFHAAVLGHGTMRLELLREVVTETMRPDA